MLKRAEKMASEWKSKRIAGLYLLSNVDLMGFALDTSDPSMNFRYVPLNLMQCW